VVEDWVGVVVVVLVVTTLELAEVLTMGCGCGWLVVVSFLVPQLGQNVPTEKKFPQLVQESPEEVDALDAVDTVLVAVGVFVVVGVAALELLFLFHPEPLDPELVRTEDDGVPYFLVVTAEDETDTKRLGLVVLEDGPGVVVVDGGP